MSVTDDPEGRPRRHDDVHDVGLAAGGDVRAFERLYRAHVARVHSLARRMLRDGDADEATQDVFVRAWSKLHTFRGDAAFGTWLHRLAINVMLSRRATTGMDAKRHEADDTSLDSAHGRRDTPDIGVDVERALARLPAGMRQVLLLHDVEGFRHEEIATQLGIAIGTSKSQLHRARLAMRTLLDR
jgi:RNA polymerase sigma-70 factor (ECF subfamily)